MLNQILLYSGSAFIAFWGIAHLLPTRSVISGFGEISVDNKRIITMEWIVEGISLIFIGAIKEQSNARERFIVSNCELTRQTRM